MSRDDTTSSIGLAFLVVAMVTRGGSPAWHMPGLLCFAIGFALVVVSQ